MSESENRDLAAALHALLFVAGEPAPVSQFASALEVAPAEVEQCLQELEVFLARSGLRIQRHAGRIQLTTAAEMAPLIERFLGLEAASHLSRAAVETLAVVAYQQPSSRPQIEAVRGVNCDGVVRSLLSKGLIQEVGRGDGPGRPILYGTAPEFLQHFGLSSLSDLPPLELPELENGQPADEHLKG